MTGRIILALVIVLAVLQTFRPRIPQQAATAELQVPSEIHAILERDCYSCHSDQVRLSWFDQIVPAYWLVRHDILKAREHLDFSKLGAQPPAVQRAVLYEAVNMVELGAMPLPQFVMLHREAKVSPEDMEKLTAYLAPWSLKPPESASNNLAENGPPASLIAAPLEFNGLRLDTDFKTWKPISTTDRGDNNTLRFILGNDIALKAVQSGDLSPWPNGARLAKIAWQQEMGPDGLIHPGRFVQVELMAKDSGLYRKTNGWGWGRWRGLDLTPYGHDAHFVKECTSCHMPVAGNDDVYTLPMTTANVRGREVVNRSAATLPVALPWQPLGWNAITLYVDPVNHTTSVLFGDPTAMLRFSLGLQPSEFRTVQRYAEGSVLALVTWSQRDDPHWFGARIPDVPRSVEFVQVAATNRYRRFVGSGLSEVSAPAALAAERTSFILGLPPAQLP